MSNTKVNLFIVGAAKSGTSSLYFNLQEHPNVFLPKLKELHYFSYPNVKNTYYKVPIITNIEKYSSYFNMAKTEKYLADFSPSYLFYEEAAKRIHEYNPSSKIIIVLRNPIERAISHYLMDVKLGYQNKELIDILINKDEFKGYWKEYIEIGLYSEQIKTYLHYFGHENVKILLFEDMRDNVDNFMNDVFNFLNITHIECKDKDKRYNSFGKPKIKSIFYLRNIKLIRNLLNIIPTGIKEKIRELLIDTNVKKPLMLEERKILSKIFENDIQKTISILNLNQEKWI